MSAPFRDRTGTRNSTARLCPTRWRPRRSATSTFPLRGKTPGVPADVNAFWTNQSFHNYADYAMGEAWRAGVCPVARARSKQRCATMCAEAVWWRCHRRIIADYLLSEGETVFHILERNHVVCAQLTAAAQRGTDGALTYSGRA
jgi:hypothetical protein